MGKKNPEGHLRLKEVSKNCLQISIKIVRQRVKFPQISPKLAHPSTVHFAIFSSIYLVHSRLEVNFLRLSKILETVNKKIRTIRTVEKYLINVF